MQRCKHDAQATTCRLCYLEKNKNNKQQPTKIEKCIYLGKRVRNANGSIKTELCTEGCAKGTTLDIFECEVYGEATLTKCRRCPLKCLKKDISTTIKKVEVPKYLKYLCDPNKIGIVIGTKDWPHLTELQIKMLRHNCGDLPILIADDCSEGCEYHFNKESTYGKLHSLTEKYKGVYIAPNAVSLGHGAGDLSVFTKALSWAKIWNIEYLVKLSRRMLIDIPYWVQYWTHRLIKDNNAVALQKRSDFWPVYTSCIILKTDVWFPLISELHPVKLHSDKSNLYVEHIFKKVIDTYFRGVYTPLTLFKKDVYRKNPGVTWHEACGIESYKELFIKYGVLMDEDFTAQASGQIKNFNIG